MCSYYFQSIVGTIFIPFQAYQVEMNHVIETLSLIVENAKLIYTLVLKLLVGSKTFEHLSHLFSNVDVAPQSNTHTPDTIAQTRRCRCDSTQPQVPQGTPDSFLNFRCLVISLSAQTNNLQQ